VLNNTFWALSVRNVYNDHRSYTTSILRRSFRLQTPIFEGGVVPLAGHLTLFPRLRRRLPSPRLADFSTDLRRSIMRSSVLYKLGTTDLRSPPAPLKLRQYGAIDIGLLLVVVLHLMYYGNQMTVY